MTYKNVSLSQTALVLALAAAPAAPTVWAQETRTTQSLEEVIVTAQKREENLQTVAASVGTLNSEQLAASGVNSFLDAVTQVAGVSFLQTGELRSTIVSVRGIGSSSNNIGIEPSTTLMLDGEVMVRSGAINGDLFDLERLEVLRGPQSTLFGKNTSAGLIHYVSKRPNRDRMEGRVDLKGAEDNEYKVNMVFSGPLSDSMAFRASGYYSTSDGYQKNTYPGNPNAGEYESYGLRTQLLFDLGEETELLLRGEYSYKDTNCCGSSIVSVDNPNVQVRTSLTDPTQTVNLFELTNTRIGYDHGTTSMNDLQQHELVNKAVSAELNTPIGDHTLTYQAYYRDWEETGNIDPWASAIKIYPRYFAGTNVAKSMQHELRLTSPGGELFDYVVGVAYFDADVSRVADEKRCSNLGQGTVIDPTTLEVLVCRRNFYATRPAPPRAIFNENGIQYDFFNTLKTSMVARNYAAFGQLDYNITSALKFSIGARVLHETTELEFEGGRNDVFDWPNLPGDTSNRTSDDAVIGKTAIQYNWTDDLMTYASYAIGYKGHGWFNTISVSRDRLNQGALKPEEPEQYEIGVRSQWFDRRFTMNLTAFHIDNKNFQERVSQLDPVTNVFVGDFRNIHIRSKGAEAEFALRPLQGLTIDASVAYTDATYQDGFQNCPPDRLVDANGNSALAPSQAQAAAGQCFAFIDGLGRSSPQLSLDGLQIANSLEWQYNASAGYRFPVTSAGDELGVQLKYRWQDEQQSQSDQRRGTITQAYGITDLVLSFNEANDRYRVGLFVKNLFDKPYYSHLVAQPDYLGGGYRGSIARDFHRYFGAEFTLNLF